MRPSRTDARRRWLCDTVVSAWRMVGVLIRVGRSVVNGSDGRWESCSYGSSAQISRVWCNVSRDGGCMLAANHKCATEKYKKATGQRNGTKDCVRLTLSVMA